MSDIQRENLISIEESDCCYRRALRRVAIFLNSADSSVCRMSWLKKTDNEIESIFTKRDLDKALIAYKATETKVETPEQQITNEEKANYDFYGRFVFQPRRSPKRLHITFENTEFFRENIVKGLRLPELPNSAIEHVQIEDCLTNYLVKNFWHNSVHRFLQNINDINFHQFRGDARYESDFTADNLGSILLALSYGIDVRFKGKSSPKLADEIDHLFSLNRCNLVFLQRSLSRNETFSEIQEFQERMWRFKRAIANQLSVSLLMRGGAVSDLAIYFSGEITPRPPSDPRGGFYHTGTVIARLNGLYIDSGEKIYLEDYLDDTLEPRRSREIREFRTNRINDIITKVSLDYIQILKQNRTVRDSSEVSWKNIERRLFYHLQ